MKPTLRTIERFRLTSKLICGFSVGILVALLIGLNALSSLSKLEADLDGMYQNDLLGIAYLKDANLNLIYMSRAMRHMLIAQDDATRDASLAAIRRARETLLSNLAEARKRMVRAETITRYEAFERELNPALDAIEQAVGLIQRETSQPSVAASFITSKAFAAIISAADNGLHELSDIKEKGAALALQKAQDNAAQTRRTATLLLALGVALAIGLGILIGLSIKMPNERLRQAVEGLAAGKVDEEIPHQDYPNEVGVMARAIGVLQRIYQQANSQHWIKSNVSDISAALQGCDDLRRLTQTAVSKVAAAIGAGHGAFYVAEGEMHFNLLASYGYRERKQLSNSFALGEGLVGQCAMEKSPITLHAPRDYIQINSGLGEGPPACISIMPVILGNRVLGVLEMASFQSFSERELALLEALLPVLATSLEILDRNLKTRELLTATQEQAVRMEKQAAQLEEQTVEMEAQQAELLETENWFRSIIEAAPDGMLVVDAAGRILLSNPMAETIFGYAPGELIGKQIEQLVPPSIRDEHPGKRAQFIAAGQSRVMGDASRLAGLTRDGQAVPVFITLSVLPERGGRGKCVSVSVRRIESTS